MLICCDSGKGRMGSSKQERKSDQRGARRIPLNLKVDCEARGHFLFENATNISEHGIFIETTDPMNPGTMINLQFTVPDARSKIEVLGEVAWVNPNKNNEESPNPGMGIRFVNLKEIDKDTILSLIKRLAVL
jgi:type IV pilus assembly protein PilZ